jgi:hypothetical protein
MGAPATPMLIESNSQRCGYVGGGWGGGEACRGGTGAGGAPFDGPLDRRATRPVPQSDAQPIDGLLERPLGQLLDRQLEPLIRVLKTDIGQLSRNLAWK